MDSMIRIVGIGISVAVIIGVLRNAHAPMAVQLSVAFTVVILMLLVQPLREVMSFFSELGRRSGIETLHLDVILKAVGIAYIASIGAQIAKDAGEQGVAGMIELGGKVLILTVGMPVFSGILLALLRLLP